MNDPLTSSLLSFNHYENKIKELLISGSLNELLSCTDFTMTKLQLLLLQVNKLDLLYDNQVLLQHVINNSIGIDKTCKIILHILKNLPTHIVELLIRKLVDNDTIVHVNCKMSTQIFEHLSLNVITLLHTSAQMSSNYNYVPNDEDIHAVFMRKDDERENILNYLLNLIVDINKHPQIINLACRYGTVDMLLSVINKGVYLDKYVYDYVTVMDYRYGYPGTIIMKYRSLSDKLEMLPIIFEHNINNEQTKITIYNEYLAYACKTQCELIIELVVKYLNREGINFIERVLEMKYCNDTIFQLIKNNKFVSILTVELVNKSNNEQGLWNVLKLIRSAPIIVTSIKGYTSHSNMKESAIVKKSRCIII